ncbi:hypothetical protein LQG66_00695 [Bradyrhizobium ontarionense]|uniref:Energy transducer TonB n=1 Tax=Bradyrhizobium ontarionense TaxID=2898149 RepID=A0ABY3RDZ8_9BRAD|nr:hypothetical protein [Bradyrhizobium sp. A19]UFZ04874.1 hypothetical protein LQG66_00695 [Bradyrhizobium sp. A19]
MQANEVPPRRKLSITPQAVLAAGVVVMFLLLHLVAGAILQGAATRDGSPATPVSTLQDYD